MTKPVRAKKHLGQHFLKEESVAKRIASTLTGNGYDQVMEIGPGMGVLTKYLLEDNPLVIAMEIDKESVEYLGTHFDQENLKIVEGDFLKQDLNQICGNQPFAISGNFPYNISSQIVFRALDYRVAVPEFSGMFQKEVAQRICSPPGSKVYGILSVLCQAYYQCEYLFTVKPGCFNPPPKVDSGVIRMTRRTNYSLPCDEELFKQVVKRAFQQRRKTLRNSLKVFDIPLKHKEDTIFAQRPEQLSVSDFIRITQMIDSHAVSTDDRIHRSD
ncbi:16S rRNA (adenine(1518)-N(6)/adenine(1519)-N(6))-dimethyltransferase RsmA [Aureitalea marina]|uniref:Ribosomal RNA small subunit methyltransferase A n=1 Tax=Aureitalea marina TaxID=930804 RepID=A0A2S7KRJ9_9FLAO|nr:16S rRNA (adenine(1518)-N(6)/adenine(1519)-N(6))-dimethyltransferase RsmA [Aureitalea marina]PQB05251.1 16S rRNA (adenine(1518)-N(6)/adenine(1519)-N(6))-dimethyltransferase [Aureitalea marina]